MSSHRPQKSGCAGRRNRHGSVAIALCVALLVVSGQASADWRVYDDKAYNELRDVNTKLKQIYEQSHVEGTAYNPDKNKTLSLQDGNDSKVEVRSNASDLQTARCRVESENAVSSDQSTICKDIITKEEKLNNYLVNMLDLTKKRQEELQSILQERKDIKSGSTAEFGSLESNTNKLLALQTQIQIDQMNLRLTMDSYTRYFADQNAKLADLTRDLQRGKGGSLVDGVKRSAMLAGVLAAAHLYQSAAQD